MRFASLCLALAAVAFTGIAHAEDTKADAPSSVAAVNTLCPVSGMKIDPKIAPVAGKTKEGKTVMIGTCSAADAAKVKENPDHYADDAVANRKHEHGTKDHDEAGKGDKDHADADHKDHKDHDSK